MSWSPDQPALEKIAEHFGPELITPEGALDRAALRHKVFADDAERDWLQKLLHPLINAYIAEELASADSAYAMLAHPILIETGQTRICDRVLVVDVPERVQIERTMARDKTFRGTGAQYHGRAGKSERTPCRG